MYGQHKTARDNKKVGHSFTYSCHRVSVYNRGSGCTWRSVRGHILHPGGISSHRNRQWHNHVAVNNTIWYHSEGTTQDISKLCHHEQQGEIDTICSNKKGVVWHTTQRATVLQEFVEVSWGIWVPYQPIWPMCGEKDYKHQTDAGSMTRGWPKGFTCQKF